jgi:7-cyano-7-deazaguanine synthase
LTLKAAYCSITIVGSKAGKTICVLTSGGADSSILVAELIGRGARVQPVYVKSGFKWEKAELWWLGRLLRRLRSPLLSPLEVLEAPAAPLLGGHWGLTGKGVPGRGTPDESVYLPGRNLILLSLAGTWCAQRGIGAIAIATLKGNPFGDATPRFRAAMAKVLREALGRPVKILAPYAGLPKSRLLRRVPGFPIELTFSCVSPTGKSHCGRCSKCEEREKLLP